MEAPSSKLLCTSILINNTRRRVASFSCFIPQSTSHTTYTGNHVYKCPISNDGARQALLSGAQYACAGSTRRVGVCTLTGAQLILIYTRIYKATWCQKFLLLHSMSWILSWSRRVRLSPEIVFEVTITFAWLMGVTCVCCVCGKAWQKISGKSIFSSCLTFRGCRCSRNINWVFLKNDVFFILIPVAM